MADTSILAMQDSLQISRLQNELLLFEAAKFVAICYSSCRKLIHILKQEGENGIHQSRLEVNTKVSQKTKNRRLPHSTAIPLLGVCLKDSK